MTGASVTVLMGVHNGARHLGAQLDSLLAQDHGDWHLIASDDGSTDESRAMLAAFAAETGRAELRDGPRQGAAANFMALAAGLPAAPGWVAFSDQDDVWLPDRLSRGQAAMAATEGPALYCSRTWVAAPDLTRRRLSAPRPRPPSFANALVQNIAAGNTMLLNPDAAALVRAAAAEAGAVVVHDWWVYQIVTGAGGQVIHDDRPTLIYRQHGGNQIGANDGWAARLRRLWQVADGTFAGWNRVNVAALRRSAARLTPAARETLEGFAALPHLPGARARLAAARALGLYRQTRAQDAALWLAVATGRV